MQLLLRAATAATASTDDTNDNDNKKINQLIAKLFVHRKKREEPQCDNKILCDWNSLVIDSLVYASRAFQEPKFCRPKRFQ